MWRRAIIIAAVLCGIVVGTVAALKSRRVADNLKSYLARVAHERYGVTLHIDHLELELLPPGVTVRRVEIYRPDRPEPWATLHRGRIVIRPWPSAAGALVIHILELDGLRADVDLRGMGDLLAPEEEHGRSRMAIDIRELFVWNTDFILRTDNGTLDLKRGDVRMAPAPAGGREVEVSIGEAVVERDDERYELEGSARGLFRGTLDRPESLTLERSTLFMPRVAISATGSIELTDDPELAMELQASAPLRRLRELVSDLPALEGDVTAAVELSGPVSAPRSRVQARVENLRGFGRAFGNVELTAVHEGTRVSVESFTVRHPSAGGVTGSGTVTLTPEAPITVSARLHHASLPHILDLAGLPDAWVRLNLSGDMHLAGRLRPLRLNLDLKGTVTRFSVLDGSYRSPEAVAHLSLGPTGLEGPVIITRSAVLLGGLRVQRGESALTVEGSLSYDEQLGLDLRAAGEQFEMAEIGPIAGIPFEGHGAIAATIEGPYASATVSGTAELSDFAVLGHVIGDTKATLIYSDLRLSIDRATVRHDVGTAAGSGAFLFEGEAPAVRAAIRLNRFDAEHLLVTAGLPPDVASRFAARVTGEARLAGPVELPGGRLNVRAPSLRIDGVPVGDATLRGGFGSRTDLLWGELDLKPPIGSVRSRVVYKKDETMTIAVDARAVSLALVAPFLGDIPLTGSVTGTAELAGRPDALSGTIEASAADLVAWGLRLETADLSSELEGGRMSVTGTMLSGDVPVAATLNLGRRVPFTATARFDAVPVQRVYSLDADIGVTVGGSFFAQGDLTHADSLMADLQVASAEATWAGFTLTSVRPARIQYATRKFTIDDLSLAGAGTTLGMSGTATTTGELSLRLLGKGDLRSMTMADSTIEWLGGTFHVDATIDGSLSTPELYGEGSVTGGALRLASGAQVIESVQARVDLAGRGIHIESGSAQTGGGSLRFGGQIALFEGERPRLDLRADIDSVNLRPYTDLHTRLSGNLNLSGPVGDLILRGRVDLEAVRYTVNIDLEKLIPRRHAPLSVPTFEEGRAIALAIAVTGENNLILSNNVVEAEFQADLMLTGTTERLGMIGSLTPLWAKARYRDNEFAVERGSIDFTEEFIIFTRFDIHATSEACGMKVAVDIHGNSDSYNVVPSGQDASGSVDPQDVLACLQFGMRLAALHDHGGDQPEVQSDPWGAFASSPYATGLDALWTVSGMDEKVKRLLPIQLDEVRLESGWSSQFKRNTMRVRVGKELSKNLQLKYSSSLDEVADQTFSVEYRLSEKATVEGTWLTASDVPIGDLGVDLKLRLEFR